MNDWQEIEKKENIEIEREREREVSSTQKSFNKSVDIKTKRETRK